MLMVLHHISNNRFLYFHISSYRFLLILSNVNFCKTVVTLVYFFGTFRCCLLVDFAIACLKMFVMENWSGPCLDEGEIPACITALFTEVIWLVINTETIA